MAANIALLSGEVSGDVVGGALARELKQLKPDLDLWGVGSRTMERAGVDLLYDSSHWSAIGIIESLKIYPELRFNMYPHVLREIALRKPALVICIDFGAFNIKVCRWSSTKGIKLFYYFPPGSWKRSGRINPEIPRLCDKIAAPFPWAAKRYQEVGGKAEFVGHPLLDIAKPSMSRAQFADKFGMEPGDPIIGLLPGSRGFEIQFNTPAMLSAARIVSQQIPNAQFVLGLAPHSDESAVQEMLRSASLSELDNRKSLEARAIGEIANALSGLEGKLHRQTEPKLVTPEGVQIPASAIKKQEARGRRATSGMDEPGLPPVVIAKGMAYDVMAHSDALVVCSGTATLEAAIIGTPMVIIYRGSKLMEMEYKLRRLDRIEHIGMPNIIAGERIVPELLQDAASPEAIAKLVEHYLTDPELRARTKSDLGKVRDTLGGPGASHRTALIALQTAGLVVTQQPI